MYSVLLCSYMYMLCSYWNRLEMFCRDLTKKYSTVRVISGPLYLPSDPLEEGGKRYVKYQVKMLNCIES